MLIRQWNGIIFQVKKHQGTGLGIPSEYQEIQEFNRKLMCLKIQLTSKCFFLVLVLDILRALHKCSSYLVMMSGFIWISRAFNNIWIKQLVRNSRTLCPM